ncbi:hypothetical protein ACLOJK_017093 [Asimina triloba]
MSLTNSTRYASLLCKITKLGSIMVPRRRIDNLRKDSARINIINMLACSWISHLKVEICSQNIQVKDVAFDEDVQFVLTVIRSWLVRRYSGVLDLLKITRKLQEGKGSESDHVLVKPTVLPELQRRILKAEAALRAKEEENTMLHQRVHQYETRWSEYEQKMKSMEEVWQKQMKSLQSSLAIAKKSISVDEPDRKSIALVHAGHSRHVSWDVSNKYIRINDEQDRRMRSRSRDIDREMSAGLGAISHLTDVFEQRTQDLEDDAKLVGEVNSGQAEVSINPERELRRLKQTFESWKKDYNLRLRETKVILQKLGNDGANGETMRKKWWRRRKSRTKN